MRSSEKYLGSVVEYLEQGHLRPALVVREQEHSLVVLDAAGRQKTVGIELILLRHGERHATASNFAAIAAELERERARLLAELDLNLLWEIVQEQGRGFSAAELAELFFGHRSTSGTAVMLEALLADRLYFVRRQMEFLARSPEQVERLRVQNERIRMRSEDSRRTLAMIREILSGRTMPNAPNEALRTDLSRYLDNPFTRSRELTAILNQAVSEVSAPELAFELLERLGAAPTVPRFALIGGVRRQFPAAALSEATAAVPGPREVADGGFAVTIDDEETREVDDAISCETLRSGGTRVRIHIALVADFVVRGGAMDQEAAARAATVYLPEVTIPMLPEEISFVGASLIAGEQRPVLTTDVMLGPDGEILQWSIAPGRITIGARVSYDQADRWLLEHDGGGEAGAAVRAIESAAMRLRERRRRAGAVLFQRREPKVKVHGGEIEIRVLDNASPARTLVGELMVLTNHVAARFAIDKHVPIIYRVQPTPGSNSDAMLARPRLSLYPEYHAGIGLECYAQVSSPIRRYPDLILQRQLLAALSGAATPYSPEELLTVLANAENSEAEARELERRAKRYWILRYLEKNALGQPLLGLALREGASAELVDSAARGTLHGAPTLANETRVLVRISRIDPLRGWFAMDYLGVAPMASAAPAP